MPLVHVPTMIAALNLVAGAIVPGQPDPRHNIGQYERRAVWTPVIDDSLVGPKPPVDDGQDPLEGVLFSSLTDDELGEAIRKSLKAPSPWGSPEEQGTDALAWYVSFHRDPQNWGIYIPVTGLFRFANHIAPNGPGPRSWEDVLGLAMRGLLAHERIHYAVDYAAGQIELLFSAACYIPARSALSNGQYVPDEEQLANGASLRSIRWAPTALKVPDAYQAAVQFTLSQPPGYRDGKKCVNTQDFLTFANGFVAKVAAQLPAQSKPVGTHPIDYTRFLPLGPLLDFGGRASRMATVDGTQCPVYLILDEAILGIPAGSIAIISSIPVIEHSPRFERDLRKSGMHHEWEETKSVLADPSIPKNRVDFKPWPPEDSPGAIKGWSVRVGKGNSNIRAHIHQHLKAHRWIANTIDNGDRQGHH